MNVFHHFEIYVTSDLCTKKRRIDSDALQTSSFEVPYADPFR